MYHIQIHILHSFSSHNIWQVLIERFVGDSSELQMTVLYATQVFCYNHSFPKGEQDTYTHTLVLVLVLVFTTARTGYVTPFRV